MISRCICSQSLFYVTGVFMGQKHWHDGNVRMERFFRRECLINKYVDGITLEQLRTMPEVPEISPETSENSETDL